ncbi:MAG: acetoacetate decarboxylase family protein [Gemmatimonadetes bacterium]|nr:acetoacetate decarboxylase family protein [Gemmatimonadota bacterium]
MVITRYGFENCVGAFFEMATSDARAILPAHLEPLEAMHTRSVLAVLAFQFTESEVGEYDELVMAIITPPRVEPGKPLPKAAFYPFMVATSSEASREHAIERWHLPHYMADLDFDFAENDGKMKVTVSESDQPIVELTVSEHDFNPTVNPYHCFTIEGDDRFKVNIFMNAPHSEHDEEEGELILHPHSMTEMLTLDEVSSYPMREEWYRAGVQTFEEMETI